MNGDQRGMDLFAYGTLMVPEIMARVAGCKVQGVSAMLDGAVRFVVRGEEYPGLVRVQGQTVPGILYRDLGPAAISRLDLFEGEYYVREEVDVVLKEDGCSCSAMVYLIKPEYRHLLTDEVWDYARFLEQGRVMFEREYGGYLEIEESYED